MSKYNVKSVVGTIIPDWIVEKMLDEQVRQGNKRDVSVFEKNPSVIFNEGGFNWCDSLDGGSYWYYIICEGEFPEEQKNYPRVMMVSDDGNNWVKRVLQFEKKIKDEIFYFAWVEADEDSLKKNHIVTWNFAKEVEQEKPKQIELTLDEIANKFGVSVENLKIKK